MHWLTQQLDTLVTAAGAICGWEGMKAWDRHRHQKRERA